MKSLTKLLFIVIVLISYCVAAAYSSWIFPSVHHRTYIKILFCWKIYKITFPMVLIHLNRSPSEGAMAVLFLLLHAFQKIPECATFGDSAISVCRNLRLTWFLTRSKRNFVGLVNIQIYFVDLLWGYAEIDVNRNFLWFHRRCWRSWSCGLRGIMSRITWLRDFALANVRGVPHTMWLLPIPIAWTNKSPRNISLTVMDALAYLGGLLEAQV
jgi:hypothetical protein